MASSTGLLKVLGLVPPYPFTLLSGGFVSTVSDVSDLVSLIEAPIFFLFYCCLDNAQDLSGVGQNFRGVYVTV